MSGLRSYRYLVVDVFTERPLEGNALAVFPDASGLDDATMQKIAREMNLSETTFIGPATRADCAANVRIFTPTKEMVFAGHPTIGSSFVMLDEGIVPKDSERFVLEEKVGPVSIRVEPGERALIWLTTPPITYGRTFDREFDGTAGRLHASARPCVGRRRLSLCQRTRDQDGAPQHSPRSTSRRTRRRWHRGGRSCYAGRRSHAKAVGRIQRLRFFCLPEAAFACFRREHGEFKAIGRSGKSNQGRKKQKRADSSDRR